METKNETNEGAVPQVLYLIIEMSNRLELLDKLINNVDRAVNRIVEIDGVLVDDSPSKAEVMQRTHLSKMESNLSKIDKSIEHLAIVSENLSKLV